MHSLWIRKFYRGTSVIYYDMISHPELFIAGQRECPAKNRPEGVSRRFRQPSEQWKNVFRPPRYWTNFLEFWNTGSTSMDSSLGPSQSRPRKVGPTKLALIAPSLERYRGCFLYLQSCLRNLSMKSSRSCKSPPPTGPPDRIERNELPKLKAATRTKPGPFFTTKTAAKPLQAACIFWRGENISGTKRKAPLQKPTGREEEDLDRSQRRKWMLPFGLRSKLAQRFLGTW